MQRVLGLGGGCLSSPPGKSSGHMAQFCLSLGIPFLPLERLATPMDPFSLWVSKYQQAGSSWVRASQSFGEISVASDFTGQRIISPVVSVMGSLIVPAGGAFLSQSRGNSHTLKAVGQEET